MFGNTSQIKTSFAYYQVCFECCTVKTKLQTLRSFVLTCTLQWKLSKLLAFSLAEDARYLTQNNLHRTKQYHSTLEQTNNTIQQKNVTVFSV